MQPHYPLRVDGWKRLLAVSYRYCSCAELCFSGLKTGEATLCESWSEREGIVF
jgi:hypothetical protein